MSGGDCLMVVSNIHERRAYLKKLIIQGIEIDDGVCADVIQIFDSSKPAILNDLSAIYGNGVGTYYQPKPQTETQNIRAKRNGVPGTLIEKDWNDVLEKHNFACVICGTNQDKLAIDHIIPVSRGGTNTPDNIQPLCKSCNSRKGNRIATASRENGRRGGRPRKTG